MVDFKYTKVNLLYEQNNDMCHNYYYIFYGKIYNKEHTRCRKFKFIEWFDIFDVMEFFEKDYITKQDAREFAYNIENCYLSNIKDFDDIKGLKEFYNYCNETIQNYNKLVY